MKKLHISQTGFISHLLGLVIVFVVISAVGVTAYKVYQKRNLSAKAANWSTVNSGGNTFYACQTEIKSPISSSYLIRAMLYSPVETSGSVELSLYNSTASDLLGTISFSAVKAESYSNVKVQVLNSKAYFVNGRELFRC